MTMFSIELTENERLLLIFALGAVHNCAAVVSEQSEPPARSIELARRLVNMNSRAVTAAAAAPAPQPAAKPRPIPADAKELSITPFAITRFGEGDKERLVVEWKQGQQTKKASCWSSAKDIWPRLLERVKQPLTILAVEKSGYLNIVGVK